MSEMDVLDWFKNQNGKGIKQGFTFQQIRKGLKEVGTDLSLQTIWYNVRGLHNRGYLVPRDSFPLKWVLNVQIFKPI